MVKYGRLKGLYAPFWLLAAPKITCLFSGGYGPALDKLYHIMRHYSVSAPTYRVHFVDVWDQRRGSFMNMIKKVVAAVTQIGFALAALSIVIQILYGKPFIMGDFAANLMVLIRQIGDAGLIGLIALAVILWIFSISRSESGSSGV